MHSQTSLIDGGLKLNAIWRVPATAITVSTVEASCDPHKPAIGIRTHRRKHCVIEAARHKQKGALNKQPKTPTMHTHRCREQTTSAAHAIETVCGEDERMALQDSRSGTAQSSETTRSSWYKSIHRRDAVLVWWQESRSSGRSL